MIEWIDDVLRKVDQWSVDALEGGAAPPKTPPERRSPIPTSHTDQRAPTPPATPPSPKPKSSPPQQVYRERPEMLIPMESKWQKFLYSQNLTAVAPNSFDTKHLVLKVGIPSDLRAQFWQHCAGAFNLALKNAGVYEHLLSHQCSCDAQIDADVSRTFSTSSFFGDSDVGRQALRDVLRAYCIFDAQLVYCQGMSYIAAILLMHLAPEEAFWMMVQLIKTYQLRELYSERTPLLLKCLSILDRLIETNFPQLHIHFSKLQITTDLFASEWFTALFAISLSPSHTAVIWDLLMVEGKLALFKTALALLALDHNQVLSCSAFDEALQVLKQRGRSTSLLSIEFLRLVDLQPITAEHLRAMEQLYMLK